jgi:hypothetical protein
MQKQLRRDQLVAIRLRRFEVARLDRAAALVSERRSEFVRRLVLDGVRRLEQDAPPRVA